MLSAIISYSLPQHATGGSLSRDTWCHPCTFDADNSYLTEKHASGSTHREDAHSLKKKLLFVQPVSKQQGNNDKNCKNTKIVPIWDCFRSDYPK